MSDAQDSLPAGPPLPPGFKTIEEIRDLPSAQIVEGALFNVIGFVKDYQPPISTRGTDFKCTVEMMDLSIPLDSYGLKVNIFWPIEKMPKITGPADMILLRKAKIQMWKGTIQLLSNYQSEFHIVPASNIPGSMSTTPRVPWQSYPAGKNKTPDQVENNYVIWANSHAKEIDLPSDHEFQEKTAQAMKVNKKFSLLKDVRPDRFYDILGQVRKVYESSDVVTVYVSDYTSNSLFYNYVWGEGGETSEGRDGDEYGYTKPRKKAIQSWPGPHGRLSIQLTLYDEHASFARENVKVDDWVFLSNVQMKFGKMGGILEGFLRGDRHRFDGKIQVKVMEQSDESERNDPRWIEAVKRKHQWLKKFRAQKKDILEEDSGLGNKRKLGNDGSSKSNSKKRRQEKRAAAVKKVAVAEAKEMAKLNLNENIRCAFPDRPSVPLKDILMPRSVIRSRDQEFLSPFTVGKYRANVRVIDYFPDKLEDFAVGRRASEMDMLSDYSGGEETDLEEEMRIFKSGKGFAKNIWEWRFALLVEDASSEDSKDRLWLFVDNHCAQGLLGLDDDATNLRGNQKLLNDLREQLFKLWGDLEEQKSAALPKTAKSKNNSPPSSFESTMSPPRRKVGAQPDLDSDSEDDTPERGPSDLKARSSSLPLTVNGSSSFKSEQKPTTNLSPRNKAFTCCIKQYGVKVDEEDPAKANAGNGQRWERKFGLFGTQIL